MLTDNIGILDINKDNCIDVLKECSFNNHEETIVVRNQCRDKLDDRVIALLNRLVREAKVDKTSLITSPDLIMAVKLYVKYLTRNYTAIEVHPHVVVGIVNGDMLRDVEFDKSIIDSNKYLDLEFRKSKLIFELGLECLSMDFLKYLYTSDKNETSKEIEAIPYMGQVHNVIAKGVKEYGARSSELFSSLYMDSMLIKRSHIVLYGDWFSKANRLDFFNECVTLSNKLNLSNDSANLLYYSTMKTRFLLELIRREKEEVAKLQYNNFIDIIQNKIEVLSLENKISELSSKVEELNSSETNLNIDQQLDEKQTIINRTLDKLDKLKIENAELKSEINDIRKSKEVAITSETKVEDNSLEDRIYDTVNLLDKNVLVISKENFTSNLNIIEPLFKSLESVDGEKPSTIKNKLKNSKYDLVLFQIDFVGHGSRYALEASDFNGDIIYVKGKNSLRWIGQIYKQI